MTADDHGQLRFVIDFACAFRQDDRFFGADHAAGELAEDQRHLWEIHPRLFRMVVVIQSYTEDLSWSRYRSAQPNRIRITSHQGIGSFLEMLEDLAIHVEPFVESAAWSTWIEFDEVACVVDGVSGEAAEADGRIIVDGEVNDLHGLEDTLRQRLTSEWSFVFKQDHVLRMGAVHTKHKFLLDVGGATWAGCKGDCWWHWSLIGSS